MTIFVPHGIDDRDSCATGARGPPKASTRCDRVRSTMLPVLLTCHGRADRESAVESALRRWPRRVCSV